MDTIIILFPYFFKKTIDVIINTIDNRTHHRNIFSLMNFSLNIKLIKFLYVSICQSSPILLNKILINPFIFILSKSNWSVMPFLNTIIFQEIKNNMGIKNNNMPFIKIFFDNFLFAKTIMKRVKNPIRNHPPPSVLKILKQLLT